MPLKAEPSTTVRKIQKRKAESNQPGSKDTRDKKQKLGYRVAVVCDSGPRVMLSYYTYIPKVIFMEEMHKYEDLKAKTIGGGCLIIHEDQYCCGFTQIERHC
jgi:hypothetical protein